jgi:hypothetical protein
MDAFADVALAQGQQGQSLKGPAAGAALPVSASAPGLERLAAPLDTAPPLHHSTSAGCIQPLGSHDAALQHQEHQQPRAASMLLGPGSSGDGALHNSWQFASGAPAQNGGVKGGGSGSGSGRLHSVTPAHSARSQEGPSGSSPRLLPIPLPAGSSPRRAAHTQPTPPDGPPGRSWSAIAAKGPSGGGKAPPAPVPPTPAPQPALTTAAAAAAVLGRAGPPPRPPSAVAGNGNASGRSPRPGPPPAISSIQKGDHAKLMSKVCLLPLPPLLPPPPPLLPHAAAPAAPAAARHPAPAP